MYSLILFFDQITKYTFFAENRICEVAQWPTCGTAFMLCLRKRLETLSLFWRLFLRFFWSLRSFSSENKIALEGFNTKWFDLSGRLLYIIFFRYREPPSSTPKLARFLGLIWKYFDLLVVRM